MDLIRVNGIRARGRHGANPGERDLEQAFAVDVALDVDLRAAGFSDDLGDTLDYAALHERIVSIVESTSFALLERLASELLQAIFADPRVRAAEVTVAKPELLRGATPGVTLRRRNPRYRRAFP